jgi:hypothetical protein
MGLMSFMKEAGEKLFGRGEAKAAQETAAAAPSPENIAALSKAAGDAIVAYINAQGLPGNNLEVAFDAASATVTVSGVLEDQGTKEKVLLCCGNVAGVAAVNDLLTVSAMSKLYFRYAAMNCRQVHLPCCRPRTTTKNAACACCCSPPPTTTAPAAA